ncbi:MAG: type I restriction enzyme HsdR N-terminal domain-containing protein [Trueperaceae bacterium]
MFKIPKKTQDRFFDSLKRYQAIANSQKSRDISEADTVTLVKDILADVFGYDKYSELTSEQQIKGTFCDLAVKLDEKIVFLIEVKAAGIELNDTHLRQVVNYGAHQGVKWIVLTNSLDWKLYYINDGLPINFDEVSSFNLLTLNLRNEEDIKRMFLLSVEGALGHAMSTFHQHGQLLNKYNVTQILLTEPLLGAIRRELRRLFPDIKVDLEQIEHLLHNDILKRELLEGDKSKDAQQRIKKATQKLARQAAKKSAIKDKELDSELEELKDTFPLSEELTELVTA